jgi:hypothetical protein
MVIDEWSEWKRGSGLNVGHERECFERGIDQITVQTGTKRAAETQESVTTPVANLP